MPLKVGGNPILRGTTLSKMSSFQQQNYKAYKETGKYELFAGPKSGHYNCILERPDVRFIR